MDHSDARLSQVFGSPKIPKESKIKNQEPSTKSPKSQSLLVPTLAYLWPGSRITSLTTFRTEIIGCHHPGCVLCGAGWLTGLTAHASEASKKECLAAGMDEFVSKVGVEGGRCGDEYRDMGGERMFYWLWVRVPSGAHSSMVVKCGRSSDLL